MLKINEIFYSIQGESSYGGMPCIFIRLTYCNLRCSYCDTEYSFYEGEDMSINQIMKKIEKYDCKLVEVTGGEPLMQEESIDLMHALLNKDYQVMLETGGSLPINKVPKERIKKINPFAKIINTTKCGVPLKEILNLDAFSLKRVLDVEPDFLTSDHDHEHDDDVTSLSFVSDTPLNMEKFQEWFGNLLQTKGQDILRTKGILDFKNQSDRYVFQGVHMLMDASPMGKWPEGKERSSRLVFIGRNLESMNLKEGFENCKSA